MIKIILTSLLISLNLFSQGYNGFYSIKQSTQEVVSKKKQAKGCALIYALELKNYIGRFAVEKYAQSLGERYERSLFLMQGKEEEITDFELKIGEEVVSFFSSCTKVTVIVLGHGLNNGYNNVLLSRVLSRHGKLSLLKKVSLFFSSGCGDANQEIHQDNINFLLNYVDTYIASQEYNSAFVTMKFMTLWLSGENAINSVDEANNIFTARYFSQNPETGERPKLSLYGSPQITVFD